VTQRRIRLSAAEARRVALAAQGFDRERPATPNDARHFRRSLRTIRVLQLDFVNVLVPAHFLILWSRIGAYDRTRFERFLYDAGEFTEHWAHEASVVPVEDWPLLGYRRRSYEQWAGSPIHRLPDRDAYLAAILAQVRDQGAVTASDLPGVEGPRRKAGDWHRSVPRWALEHHFGRGKLAVRQRLGNFQRVYDLPERLVATELLVQHVPDEEGQRALLRHAGVSLGVATLQDLADYYRMSPRDAAPRVTELVEAGALQPVDVEGWNETAYLSAEARLPRRIRGACLLSPFDPVVWFRPRAERLFGFEYRIEIYVPEPKRRWGYYVLPFRLGDRIVARVDLKADRAAGQLLVQRAHLEAGADPQETRAALRDELGKLANWLGLDTVKVLGREALCRGLASR